MTISKYKMIQNTDTGLLTVMKKVKVSVTERKKMSINYNLNIIET